MANRERWWESIPPEVWGQGSYTGAGSDGVVQPNMPVGQRAGGSVTVHEGEVEVPLPDGRNLVIPSAEVQQLVTKYGGKSVGGMETGGVYPGLPTDPAFANPIGSMGSGTTGSGTTGSGTTGSGTTGSGTTGSGTKYTKTGMNALKNIVTGKHPYYEAFWNRAIGEQAGAGAARTAGLKQELAMAGMSPDQKTTAMMSRTRDVEAERGKLYGNLAEAAGEMSMDAAGQLATLGQAQQRIDLDKEKYADDMRWKEYDNAIETGDFETAAEIYGDITGKYLDTSKLEEQYSWKQNEQAFIQASNYMAAGDYEGMNEVLKTAGLPPIDTAKLESNDLRGVVNDIDSTIASLGPDGDPRLLSVLGALRTNVLAKSWSGLGVNTSTMEFTDPETGETISFDDMLTAATDPDNADPVARKNVLLIEGKIKEWWEEGEGGAVTKAALESMESGEKLLNAVEEGDSSAGKVLGKVIGAAYAQANSYRLNDVQRDLLKKYDLYDETADLQSTTDAQKTAKEDARVSILEGNYTYADLPDSVKEYVDPKTFNGLAVKAITDKIGASGLLTGDGRPTLTDEEYKILYESGDKRLVGSYTGLENMNSMSKYRKKAKGAILGNLGGAALGTISPLGPIGTIAGAVGGAVAGTKKTNKYVLKDSAKKWFNSNKGKIVDVDGTLYVPREIVQSNGRPAFAFVDLETGNQVIVKHTSDL